MQLVIWDLRCALVIITGIAIQHIFAQELPNQVLLLGPPSSPILLMRWRVNLTDLILELEAQTHGWIAFGLSPDGHMDSSDVVFTWIDPGSLSVYAQDRYIIANTSTLTVNLTLDRSQNWQRLGGRQNATHTLIRTTRKLISADPNDYSFLDATKRLIYAVADTAPNRATGEIVMHSARGSMVYTGFQSTVRALQTVATTSTSTTLSPLDIVRVGIASDLLTNSTPNSFPSIVLSASSTSTRSPVLTNPIRIAPATSTTRPITATTRSTTTTTRTSTTQRTYPTRIATRAPLAPARPIYQPTPPGDTLSSGRNPSLPPDGGFPNPYSIYPEDPLGSTLLATLPTTGSWYQASFSPDFFPPTYTTTTTTTMTRATPRPPGPASSANGEAFYVQWTTRSPFLPTITDNPYSFDNRPSEESTLDRETTTMDGASSEVPNTETDIIYDELTTTTIPLTSRMSSEIAPPSTGRFANDPLPQGPVSILSFSAVGPNLTANVLGVPVIIPLSHIDPETLNTPLQNLQGGGATTAKILQSLTQMWGIIGQLVTGGTLTLNNTQIATSTGH